MKRLILVIFLLTSFSILAEDMYENIEVIQLANQIFTETAKSNHFDWTDTSCEELMDESFELAVHIIENNLILENMDPIKIREGWMP